VTRTHGGANPVNEAGIGFKVRKTLPQIDGAVLLSKRRHHRKDGGADVRKTTLERG
jgi:hypothetical protein